MNASAAQIPSAVQWKSGRVAFVAAGVAFVSAFALTIALSPPGSMRRSPAAAPLEPPAQPEHTGSAPVSALQASSGASQALPPHESPIAPLTITAAPRKKQAPAVDAASRAPTKGKDPQAIRRRYGI
jgi:hypothetical protein